MADTPDADRLPSPARRGAAAAADKVGLTLDQVAEQMTCSTSKISRLETGKGIPKAPDVRELMRIYGVTSEDERDMLLRLVHEGREHGWWERLTEGVHPERFFLDAPDRYTSLESAAAICVVRARRAARPAADPRVHPGPDDRVLPHHEPHEIERLVELRQQRQLALVERAASAAAARGPRRGGAAPGGRVAGDHERAAAALVDMTELPNVRCWCCRSGRASCARTRALRACSRSPGAGLGRRLHRGPRRARPTSMRSPTWTCIKMCSPTCVDHALIPGRSRVALHRLVRAPQERLDRVIEYRISSFCNLGNCVEVGRSPDGSVIVRDTKDPSARHAHVRPTEWTAFVAG